MVDLGTGSGILAIAAVRLGAGPVLALDIAPEAVRVTRENAAANGVAAGVQVAQASLAELLRGDFGPEWLSTPLVVANILASIITPCSNKAWPRLSRRAGCWWYRASSTDRPTGSWLPWKPPG